MELKKKNNKKYFIFAIAFFLPILIMIVVFSRLGIGLGGKKSILSDLTAKISKEKSDLQKSCQATSKTKMPAAPMPSAKKKGLRFYGQKEI